MTDTSHTGITPDDTGTAATGEMVLEKSIYGHLRAAMKHAGAERGLLIGQRDDELEIQAEATMTGEDVTVHLRDGAYTAAALPESPVRYAMRTQESVILDNGSSQNPFSVEPYIIQRRARSIPFINQAKLIGISYPENSLTPLVFTPDRVAVLKVLTSQAAISLENTRLYRDLEDREGRIRRLVDSNIIGIFIWDLEGRILEANDAFLHMVGYDREDMVSGRVRWTDLTPAEWRERDERALAELSSTGTVQPYEKDYFRKDGSRVSVLIGGALFEESGNEGVAFVLDLTERNRAEEALRESEAKFRDYAETASDWFWEIGADYKFTLLTENAFGSDPAGRIGTACWDHALDLETEPEKWRVVQETLDARRPFRDFVYRSVSGNGTPMYVKASGKPVFDTKGEFRGYRGTSTDVTATMRAREEHEKLRQLESDLAHMNRVSMMGELTASLAHEITQPIASARNNARAALNFLDRQPPGLGEVREALACVVGDADRAGEIIDRIRDHIRKTPPRKARFDLNDAIDEVIVLGRSAVTKNGVLVQTRLAEGLFPVKGDRVQLQQVILNLVLNAVEAMGSVEAGPREVLISTEQNKTNGVVVAVRDSGPGIDPEHLERVFEAFYTTKSSGVGMGLSICRSIIDVHGGRLWAEPNEPRGAVFQFALPAGGSQLMDSL